MQPNLLSVRKKFLLSGVSIEYKDLTKFAEETDPHLIGEALEDSFKKYKRRHYSLQALNPKTNYSILQLGENFMKFQKTTGQPKHPWLATRAPIVQCPKSMGRTEETIQREKPMQKSPLTSEELKEFWIKKLDAEIAFKTNEIVSCYIPVVTLRVDVEKLKGTLMQIWKSPHIL